MSRKQAPTNIIFRHKKYGFANFYVTKNDAEIVKKRLEKQDYKVVMKGYAIAEYSPVGPTVTNTGRPESVNGQKFYGLYIRNKDGYPHY